MLDTVQPVAFLPSTDLARTRVFYGDLLGLPLIHENPYVCVFRCGPITLRVTLVDQLAPQPFTVFGWDVLDIRDLLGRLAHVGVTAIRFEGLDQDSQGVWTAPSEDLVAWFNDPDGNTLSLTQFSRPT